ncbi:MAG TPA: hypothetical protein VF470_00300 [Sphingomicrobium sp.]
MSAGKLCMLDVDAVELDKSNPRIRRFLEHYVGEITYDQIALALDVAGGEGGENQGATTPEKLRNSILTNGGIMQPIIVNKETDGRLVCIEGNTRLYIYRAFVADSVAGEWSKIPALLHENLGNFDVDAIRLQAHLVGPRPWDAYSKAKYQAELFYKELMPIDRLVDLCGGNRRDVSLAIQAYQDMEKHFRPLFKPGEHYDTQQFSGFVELQNTKIKNAILASGFDLGDFASWIKGRNIVGLASVRQLPRVLADPKARQIFLKKDIKAALDVLDKPELTAGLKDASLSQLARALTEKIGSLPYSEIQRLRENSDEDAVRYVDEAREAAENLLADISSPN